MTIDEIRESVKTQITDPIPDAIMKVFQLGTQDIEITGTDSKEMPMSRQISHIHGIGYYKTKLDAIMHMIEISPSAFKDGKLEKPVATTTFCSDIYEVYAINSSNPGHPNIKTFYFLKEIVLD